MKELGIDNQGLDDQHPICDHFDMDHVLPALLKRLPILQSFSYVGPLSAKVLAAIVQVDSLRVLQVRNGDDVLKGPATPTPIVIIPWTDITLDWSALASLKGLQALEIGRLIRREARGLAKGVASLNLRRLRLSFWGWEYANINSSITMRSTAHTSALVMFLDTLTTLDLGGGQICRGLPSTLEHLVLIDKYRTWIPYLHQFIATAILPCENLEIPSTTINVSGRCHDTLTKMGLPAFHKIVGVSSWQQLSYDEEMEIVHQYCSRRAKCCRPTPIPNHSAISSKLWTE